MVTKISKGRWSGNLVQPQNYPRKNQYIMPGAATPDFCTHSAFVRGYIQAAFFTSCGPDDGELSDKGYADLAPETLATMLADCSAFMLKAKTLLRLAYIAQEDYTEEKAGLDFWYTRCGHGVGYWDRELGKVGEGLTTLAEAAGNVDLYLGDDGLIYA